MEAALRVSELVERLLAEGAEEEAPARSLLGYLLDYYRREDKSQWWEYFHLLGLDAQELVEERKTLGGLEFGGEVGKEKRSTLCRYRFPPQDHGIEVGQDVRDPATQESPGSVVEVSDGALILKRGPKIAPRPHPLALVPLGILGAQALRDSLFRLGERVVEEGFAAGSPRRAAFDLLQRVRPRSGSPGVPLVLPGEDLLSAARRLGLGLDRSVLPIQGPPGSGKTYLGGRIITALLAAGPAGGGDRPEPPGHHQPAEPGRCRAADDERVGFRGVQITSQTGCAPIPASRSSFRVRQNAASAVQPTPTSR